MTADVTVQLIKSAGERKRCIPSSVGILCFGTLEGEYFPLHTSRGPRARAGLTEGKRQPKARAGLETDGRGLVRSSQLPLCSHHLRFLGWGLAVLFQPLIIVRML